VEGRLAGLSTAGSVARKDVVTASVDELTGDVRDRVERSGLDTAVVVNEQRVVFGILRPKHLQGDPDRSVADAMSPGPSTFRPHVLIHEMAHFMDEHDLPSSPVTTGDGRLVGLLTREDTLRATEELRRELGAHEHEVLDE
jgi:CBS domain-containing protein